MPTQFYIEKILEDFRPSINDYRNKCFEITNFKESVDLFKKTEDILDLQLAMQKLQKEKGELINEQEVLYPEDIILGLIELMNDPDKFTILHASDFTHEIDSIETELESAKREWEGNTLEKIEEELPFPIEQLAANIRIKQRQILNWDIHLDDLHKLPDMVTIESKIIYQQKLEQQKADLLLEVKKFNPITFLKQQVEKSNTNQENRSDKQIKTDLKKNAKLLSGIILDLQAFIDLIKKILLTNDNPISFLVKKIEFSLNLALDIKTQELNQKEQNKQLEMLEEKQSQLTIDLRDNYTIQNLKEQIALDQEKLNLTHKKYSTNQKELTAFFQENKLTLIALLAHLLDERIKNINENQVALQHEKEKFDRLEKENKLLMRISELEKKINSIKRNQRFYNLLVENEILPILNHLKTLKKISDKSTQKVDELEKTLADLEKKRAEIASKPNQELLKSLLKKIKTCSSDLKKAREECETQEKLEKIYKKEIKKIIKNNCIQLVQDSIKKSEESLLDTVAKSSEGNLIIFSQQEKNFFKDFISRLKILKDQVDSTEWNKSGLGFFCKKVPDGIQKVRFLLDKMPLDSKDSQYHERNLIMLSLFSDIYHLIKQKNSSNKCLRSRAVKYFYLSMNELLKSLNAKLKDTLDPDWFRLLTTNNHSAFNFPSNNLFKEQTPEVEDTIQFPTCFTSCRR